MKPAVYSIKANDSHESFQNSEVAVDVPSCLLTVNVISIASLHQVFLSRSPKSREAAADVLNCLNLPSQDIGPYLSPLSNI